jgi:hypothetical protein
MASREETQVKELRVSAEQMQAAVQRASDNAKTWVVWEDAKASVQAEPKSA